MDLALMHVQITASKQPRQGYFTSVTIYFFCVYPAVYPSVKWQENSLISITSSCPEQGRKRRVCVWPCLCYSPLNSQSLTCIFLSMVVLGFFFAQNFPFALLPCQLLTSDWLLRKR